MRSCHCPEPHARRKIVLTGGPGAGKTAVLEMLRLSLCRHVVILPEAAGILFNDGFPRDDIPDVRRAAQRAIYHVQTELERAIRAKGTAVMLCDRGVVDGVAYWPGPGDLFAAVGTTRADALARYDAVIHLRVPAEADGYGHSNPHRIESAAEARAIDDRILAAWSGHPRVFVVESANDFFTKATEALQLLESELPSCCRVATAGLFSVPAVVTAP